MSIEIRHDRCASRISALDGEREVGYVTYSISEGTMDIEHTVVLPEMRGQGIAARLVDRALDFARDEGLKAVASCSYAANVIAKR